MSTSEGTDSRLRTALDPEWRFASVNPSVGGAPGRGATFTVLPPPP